MNSATIGWLHQSGNFALGIVAISRFNTERLPPAPRAALVAASLLKPDS